MKIGDKVNRKEEREVVGATVIEIDGDFIYLTYDEGGGGWWPISCLDIVEASE